MSTHKHILFILDYYLPHRGWSETVFEAIISRLLAKWYTITLLTSHFDLALPREEKKENIHVYRTGKGRISFMFWWLIKWFFLLKKHKDISVIHTSTYGWAIPASVLGKLFGKRVILTVHEVFWMLRKRYKWRWWSIVYRWFERVIFWFPYSVYHCVSYYTMNSLRVSYGIDDAKIMRIPNGVDTVFRNPEEVTTLDKKSRKNTYGWNNRFVVTYYGHAGKSKGIDYLVEALPGLIKADSRLLFVFNCIDSKRTEYIKNRIRNLCGLGTSTILVWSPVQLFDGMDKEALRTLIASSDMIVAPSLSEWFGSVHTESVAMKKPLLTTYVASLPEVLWWNVKYIPPASSREISQAILQREEWIENPDYLIPQKTFSRNDTVKELIKLYR